MPQHASNPKAAPSLSLAEQGNTLLQQAIEVLREATNPDDEAGPWMGVEEALEAIAEAGDLLREAESIARSVASSDHITSAHRAQWLEWLALLRDYMLETGHASVPTKYVTPAGRELGRWLAQQHMANERGELPVERLAALNALGVAWQDKPEPTPRRANTANSARTMAAASGTVEQARALLAEMPDMPAIHRQVLDLRVRYPADSLAQLAERSGVSKSTYAGALRRALTRAPSGASGAGG